MKKKVLVSAIGGPTGAGVVKCLRKMKDVYVIGLDADPNCPLKGHVNKFVLSPPLNDTGYISFVNELIVNKGVTLYYPTLQPELIMLPQITCPAAAPSAEVIANTLDKVALYDTLAASELDILVPAYASLNSLDDFDAFYATYSQQDKPICIKMRNGHGGIGFKVIVQKSQLLDLIASGQDQNYYDVDTLREALAIDIEQIDRYLVCEYLEGPEVSVDMFAVAGDVVSIVTRKRNRVSNGIVLDGKVELNDQLIAYSTRLAKTFNLTGFSNVQFKYDSAGLPKLIDFNPRFCGSQLISYGAGVNFPYLAFCYYHNLPLPVYSPTDNMVSKRYWKMKFFPNP